MLIGGFQVFAYMLNSKKSPQSVTYDICHMTYIFPLMYIYGETQQLKIINMTL